MNSHPMSRNIYIVEPSEYFRDHYKLDETWFAKALPEQIMQLISIEKKDLHSKIFSKQDCHTIIVYLKKKHRDSIKRMKKNKLDIKNKKGFIQINSKKIQENECSICLELPNYDNLLTTECGHSFCYICYDKWISSSINLNKNYSITCPNCRKNNPKVKQYIVIKKKKSEN